MEESTNTLYECPSCGDVDVEVKDTVLQEEVTRREFPQELTVGILWLGVKDIVLGLLSPERSPSRSHLRFDCRNCMFEEEHPAESERAKELLGS